MQKLKQTLFIGLLSLLFLNPVFAVAAGNTNTVTNTNTNTNTSGSTAINVPEYTGVEGSIAQFLCTPSEGKADGKDLERCINKLYRFGIAFGGIALVFFLVYAGYIYIVGGESGKGKAKGVVQNALVGIALLLGSYVILYFINPNLTIIKPIQPPIFTAADFPSCEDIGFEDTCVINGSVVPNGGSGRGEKVPCPGKSIVTIGSLGLPGSSGLKICKAFGEKLLQAYNQTKATPWVITSTIRDGGAESLCHKAGNEFSGTCADVDFTGADATKVESWNSLCRAIKGAGLYPHNEVGHQFKATLTDCGKFNVQKYASKDHVHTAWFTGGGGGGTGGGGSRPYCKPNKDFSFLCDSPSGSPWSDDRVAGGKAGFTSSDPTIQANLTELKNRLAQAKVPEKNINQSYRPHEYSSHMRSFWEASALISGKTDAQVNKKGFYCDGSIQFVKKADIDKLTKAQKDKIVNHASLHDMNKWDEPTTCLSDHGFGYAVDVDGANPANMEKFGLCRNLQGPKWNQRLDAPHYVLKEKNRNTEGCK